MVVAGILALALALPTGALFGIGYGTGVRIGYEQIYPLLFPANKDGDRDTTTTVENVNQINKIYNAIGGKEASQMGMAVGLSSVMSELDKNPDFLALLKLESTVFGNIVKPSAGTPSPTTDSSPPLDLSNYSLSEIEGQLFKPTLTLEEKQFLISQILIADMASLLRMKQQYTDLNLLQLIRTRINTLAEEQREENLTGNVVPQNPVIGIGTPQTDSYVRAQYQNKVFTLHQPIITSVNQWNDLAGRNFNSSSAVQQGNSLQNKIPKLRKTLINFITISRNDIKLKSLANKDWNDRIWLIPKMATYTGGRLS